MALLIWGTRMVRTGVTRAYGSALRAALGRSVGNRFGGLVAGIGVTAVLQSSTATALMATSFAGRGLMETAPALTIMLGADVGTTLVAQVLSFDLGLLPAVLVAAGVIAHLATENSRIRQLGRAVIGGGLMLLALKMIVAASLPIRDSEALRAVLGSLAADAVIAALLAALLTWLAHSSLAVVLLVMSLAQSGVVPVALAFALVIGANVGGTLPAIMATLAQPPEARRIPIGNAAFKLAGAVALLPLVAVIQPWIATLEADAARQVVNFHTAFNLAVAAAFIFLVAPAARLAAKLLPSVAAADDPGRPRHLDRTCIDTPTVALACAARETIRMGDIVETMLRRSFVVIRDDDPKLAAEVRAMDDQVDRLHQAIKLYVTEATRESLDEAESRRATEILTFTTNLEHAGDIVENLMDLASKKMRRQVRFSEPGLEDIVAIHARVVENLKLAFGIFMSGDVKLARQLLAEKKKIIALERAGADNHMQRLREGRVESIETSALHMDVLRDLKRIHSHIVSVAYPVLERAGELEGSRRADEAAEASADEAPLGAERSAKNR